MAGLTRWGGRERMPFFRALKIELPDSQHSSQDPSCAQTRLAYFGFLTARLQQTTVSAQQFVYFTGLIAVAIVSAGFVGGKPLIIILAPYALTFVLTYQLQLITDVERLTTLKERLEEDLNNDMGMRIFLERDVLSLNYRNRLSVRLLQPIYIVVVIGMFLQSIRVSYRHQARWASPVLRRIHLHVINLHYLNVIGIVVCAIILIVVSIELGLAHGRAVSAIEGALKEGLPQSASGKP
jgi:hypothetical protein